MTSAANSPVLGISYVGYRKVPGVLLREDALTLAAFLRSNLLSWALSAKGLDFSRFTDKEYHREPRRKGAACKSGGRSVGLQKGNFFGGLPLNAG